MMELTAAERYSLIRQLWGIYRALENPSLSERMGRYYRLKADSIETKIHGYEIQEEETSCKR